VARIEHSVTMVEDASTSLGGNTSTIVTCHYSVLLPLLLPTTNALGNTLFWFSFFKWGFFGSKKKGGHAEPIKPAYGLF
jgi:hypothetical protein